MQYETRGAKTKERHQIKIDQTMVIAAAKADVAPETSNDIRRPAALLGESCEASGEPPDPSPADFGVGGGMGVFIVGVGDRISCQRRPLG
jgi:hypothetical protein